MAANPALVRMLGYDSRGRAARGRRGAGHLHGPDHREAWVGCDGRGRRSPQCRAGAEAQGRQQDRRAGEFARRARLRRPGDLLRGHPHRHHGRARALRSSCRTTPATIALTGLANRREFEMRLQRAIEMTQATGVTHAVCYLDLDRFKVVNDTCGHVAGDELLRQLGHVLQAQGAFRGRRGAPRRRRVRDAAAQLRPERRAAGGEQPAEGGRRASSSSGRQHTFTLGVSIGVVMINSNFRRLAQVMNAADTACYSAKDAGRNRIHVFQRGRGGRGPRHGEMEWVARAKRALVDNRLFLEAQPILAAGRSARAKPLQYELLVRMRDENGRAVPPGAFLPSVERCNLSVRYDRWVITAALDWIARTRAGDDARVAGSSSTCPGTLSSTRRRHPSSGRRSPARAWIRRASASRFPRTSRLPTCPVPTS